MSSTLEFKKVESIFYVYVHKRKTDGSVFYVGKGTGERASDNSPRNIWWSRIVKKSNGYEFEIVYNNLTEQEAFKKEQELILEIGLDNLCNITKGGSGGDTLSRNPNLKEIGRKISTQCTGDLNPNKGMGYYKHWINKYGIEEANKKLEELKKKARSTPRKKRIIVYKSWEEKLKEKYGDDWEEKYNEINNKIREEYFMRPKITCEICNKEFHRNAFPSHKRSNKCAKNK